MRIAPRRVPQRHQPVAQAEAAEAQAFLLDAELELLGGQLALELALEVVEELVPAHATTVVTRHSRPTRLSTE